MVGAGVHGHAHLLGELLQFLGVFLEVLGPFGAYHSTGLSGVGARHDGAVLGEFEQGLFVGVRRVRFGCRDEARAHPHSIGAERQRGGQSAAVEQSTGGHHRDLVAHGVHDLGHQRHGGHGAGVSTTLGSLRYDEIAPTGQGRLSVANLAAHRAHEDVVLVQHVDDLAGHAESGHEDAGSALDDALDILLQLTGDGGQQVDAERLGGEAMHGRDLLVQLTRSHGRGAEGTDAAGLTDGGDELRVGDPTHSGEHHRMFDVEQVGQSGVHTDTVAVRHRRGSVRAALAEKTTMPAPRGEGDRARFVLEHPAGEVAPSP